LVVAAAPGIQELDFVDVNEIPVVLATGVPRSRPSA